MYDTTQNRFFQSDAACYDNRMDTTTVFYALASVFFVSAVSLVGAATVAMGTAALRQTVIVLVGLAVGALLGDAFIHLIPEAFETVTDPTSLALLILGGIFGFFILERFLHWHHAHTHANSETCPGCPEPVLPLGYMILFSDGFHNFLDGIIIGVSYLAGFEIGIATTVAIILHEIPQEIGDFGVLLHAGFSRARALFMNFLSALAAFAGVILALIAAESAGAFALWVVPVAAGGFIYIAVADLVPELRKTNTPGIIVLQLLAIGVGVAAMYALRVFGA